MWEREFGDYVAHLEARGLARDTVRHRGNQVKRMLAFFAAAGVTELQEVTREHVDFWLAHLGGEYRTAKGNPITTMHLMQHHLSTKDFFAWMEREGRILASPYGVRDRPERPPSPTRPPRVLSPEEAVRVLEAADARNALGLRDRSALELLYSTGMRKGELVALNVADFSFKRQELTIVKSKSRRGRMVPVGEFARHFTEAYIRIVRPWVAREEEKALFVSHHSGRRLAVRTVAQIVARALSRSGVVKPATPHTFRHSMATHMLQNRADLRYIQAILGHSLITSTEIYTHVSLEDLKAVVRRAHPHGRRKG